MRLITLLIGLSAIACQSDELSDDLSERGGESPIVGDATVGDAVDQSLNDEGSAGTNAGESVGESYFGHSSFCMMWNDFGFGLHDLDMNSFQDLHRQLKMANTE